MWELVKVRRYPALATYVGPYDGVIVEFKTGPEQLPFMDLLGEWVADRIPSEARKKGVTPLYLRVSRDIEPTFTTDWQVEFWGHESPIDPITLAVIIIAAIAAVAVAYLSYRIVKAITGYWRATVEQEEKRLNVGVELLKLGYSPADVTDFLEGVKAPPADIGSGLADAIKDIAAPALIVGGIGLVVIIALFAMSRKEA